MKLILGDSKEKLKEIASNSIDLICCDPPYQLDSIRSRFGKPGSAPAKDGVYARTAKGFMGKQWDVLPPVEVWRECLRVLKPGAFAFIMTTPRQDSLCQILGDLSEAGFMMGFSSIYWTYATGFPKAGNIAKLVDKRLKVTPKTIAVKKQKGAKFKLAQEQMDNMGFNDPDRTEFKITEATSKMAKELDGSYGGFQPKPAIEIILVCMKPLSEKTYVDQALKNKHGCTWLDDGRIPYKNEKDRGDESRFSETDGGKFIKKFHTPPKVGNVGRFPANLIVSNDVLNDGKITKSEGGETKRDTAYFGDVVFQMRGYSDTGSFSHYFSLDAWWNEKLKHLSPRIRKTFPFIIVPKPAKSEKNQGLKEKQELSQRPSGIAYNEHTSVHCDKKKGNIHPTCKPVKLMSYLVILGSRKGDVVLDPFLGSGTTGIACKLLNREFIGIEDEIEYIKIAKARIENTQGNLF